MPIQWSLLPDGYYQDDYPGTQSLSRYSFEYRDRVVVN